MSPLPRFSWLLDLVHFPPAPPSSCGQCSHEKKNLQAPPLNKPVDVALPTTYCALSRCSTDMRGPARRLLLHLVCYEREANSRGQSKPGPGSVLRPGAMSLCAAMSRTANWH